MSKVGWSQVPQFVFLISKKIPRFRGYNFTAADLEEAIEDSTAAEQGEYFC